MAQLSEDHAVVEPTILQRVVDRRTVKDPFDSGPIRCGGAHRARLRARIHRAAPRLEAAEPLACLAYRFHLTMPGGIVLGDDAIGAFRDDLAILDNDRTKHA